MESESLQWILIIAGVLAVVGVYGYTREQNKDKQERLFTKQDDLFDDVPSVDPLLDDLLDDPVQDSTNPLVDTVRGEVDETIVFHVFAQEGESFKGAELQKIFEQLKLQRTTNHFFVLTDMFHPLYQICSSFKPGYFPEQNMAEYQTKGITFFMTLPCQNAKETFEKMLLDINQVSLKLDGRILDEDRNDLSQQMLNHVREHIVSYALKK